jgi:hypothetical protein
MVLVKGYGLFFSFTNPKNPKNQTAVFLRLLLSFFQFSFVIPVAVV